MDKELELKRLEEMVDDFAYIMKVKLRKSFNGGWGGFDNPDCMSGMCMKGIVKADQLFDKKDMLQAVDVANYAMFVHAQLQQKLLSGGK